MVTAHVTKLPTLFKNPRQRSRFASAFQLPPDNVQKYYKFPAKVLGGCAYI
jgi:hypothetical protein